MSLTFRAGSFDFEAGQEVPVHVDGSTFFVDAANKWSVVGGDPVERESYSLAKGIDDEATAQVLVAARERAVARLGLRDSTRIIPPSSTIK